MICYYSISFSVKHKGCYELDIRPIARMEHMRHLYRIIQQKCFGTEVHEKPTLTLEDNNKIDLD